MPSWILAIDFGTSYTVAASKVGDRAPEVIEVGGERRMPSVIMVDTGGTIIVGRTADDLSGTHPGSTLRALKNRLGDQAPVVLDGRPYQVVSLVAELLRSVYDESVRQLGEPPSEVRLTHPAMWNRPRLNRLLEAAAKAGLPNPALVPEPVAAALSFASEVGVDQGAHVVVYDLGGGTFDSAVVTANGGGFNIVGRPSGDQNIGGELFDELIVNHLGLQLPPDAWDAIQIGEEPLWQQVGATLRNEARRAKETLSGNPYADLIVPLPTGLKQIRLVRAEFEELVTPYVAETVSLLERCVAEAGLQQSQLSGIALVGGSSRSPIVERMVREAFPAVPVVRRGDPKTAVASGAARAVRSTLTAVPTDHGRTTQEASTGTAPEPVRLAPPTSHPSSPSAPPSPSPSSAPGSSAAAAPSSHPSHPSSLTPASSQPSSQPPSRPSSPPGTPPPPSFDSTATFPASGSTVGGLRGAPPAPPAPPAPSHSSPPPPPGSRSGSATGPDPHLGASSSSNPGSAPKSRSKKLVLIGAVLVLVVAAVATALVIGGGSDSAEAQPTRKEIGAAMLTIRQVRDVLGSSWNAEDLVGGADPFCPQFALAEPVRTTDALYSSVGDGDSSSSTGFYENLSSFDSEDDAIKFYEQDQAISEQCQTSDGSIGTLPVTYTLSDVTRDADAVGREVVAIRYEAVPEGETDPFLLGWIVEARIGRLIMSTNYFIYNRDQEKSEIDDYYELTKIAFDKAADAL